MKAQFIRGEKPYKSLSLGAERVRDRGNFTYYSQWIDAIISALPAILGRRDIPEDILQAGWRGEKPYALIRSPWRERIEQFLDEGDAGDYIPIAGIAKVLWERGWNIPESPTSRPDGPEMRP
jgi:hypothetical protein